MITACICVWGRSRPRINSMRWFRSLRTRVISSSFWGWTWRSLTRAGALWGKCTFFLHSTGFSVGIRILACTTSTILTRLSATVPTVAVHIRIGWLYSNPTKQMIHVRRMSMMMHGFEWTSYWNRRWIGLSGRPEMWFNSFMTCDFLLFQSLLNNREPASIRLRLLFSVTVTI